MGKNKIIRSWGESAQALADRFWMKVNKKDGCWNWKAGKFQSGYGAFSVTRCDLWKAHRAAFLLSGRLIFGDLCVLHRCDNKICVNPSHLFLGTQIENVRDRDAKGRTARGNNQGLRKHPESRLLGLQNHASKFNPELVRQIRTLYAAKGTSTHAIADEVGVSHTAVRYLVNRKVWKHIKD